MAVGNDGGFVRDSVSGFVGDFIKRVDRWRGQDMAEWHVPLGMLLWLATVTKARVGYEISRQNRVLGMIALGSRLVAAFADVVHQKGLSSASLSFKGNLEEGSMRHGV